MAPVLYSATVRGRQLVLSYTDATDLDAVRTAAASAFAVSSAGNAAISVDRVLVSGKTVTLTLSRDVVGGETVTLGYTRPPTGDNVIQDAAGNDAASFTNQAVSNLVRDTTAPVLAIATVRGDKLDLTYTDAGKLDADAGKIAAASAFAVSSVGNEAISVSNVSVMDKTVTLTLSRAVAGGETVKLSYTRPPTGDNVIQDAAGNDAASFTNQAVSNLVRDTTAPVLASATVSGRRLVLTYTDVGKLDTDAGKIVAASAFAVSSVDNAAISVSSVAVSDKTVTLTLSRSVAGGETVKLSYTRPATGENVIQDATGNDAASFMDQAVSNLVPDTTAPVLGSATVNGRLLVLSYTDVGNLDTDAGKIVAASAFAVSSAGNEAISVSSVAVSGKTVTLALSRAVAGGETVKLSYTRPTTGDNVIQDAVGNDAASFTDQAVSNLVRDTTAPVLGSATVIGNVLELTYTDVTDLNARRIATASTFAVSSAGNAAISVDRVIVSGKTVMLILSREVAGGEMLKLSYTRPATGENGIQDAAGNGAASFTDQAVRNLVRDTTAPVLGSATVNGIQLVLTYTDVTDLNEVNFVAASAFAVSSAGNEAISVSGVVVLGKTVTLTLSRYVHGGETVKLSYTKPATGDEGIRDRAGNDAASLTDQAVSNLVRDTMAPVLRNNATVRGDLLELTYADASDLDAVKTAAASAFAVSSAGNEAISVSGVFVSGKTVTLVLDRDVAGGETLKLSYTRPPTGDEVIQDAAGNDAASFTNQAVTNLIPDVTAPVLGSATVRSDQLVLTYIDVADLDAVRIAAASAFAVSSAGNAAISVNSVAVTGKTVTLTLNRRVGSSETVKLSYTKPTTGHEVIQDTTGNDAVSFTNQAVDNLGVAYAYAPSHSSASASASASAPRDFREPNVDNDAASDAQENRAVGPAGAATGDGNADGIQDRMQTAVTSLSVTTSSHASSPITLVVGSQEGKVHFASTARIISLEQKALPAQTPQTLEAPIALTRFQATLKTAGSREAFSLYVDPKIGANGYWVQDSTGTWVNLASAPYGGKMVNEGGRLRLDFSITDGGEFDTDGRANGVISASGAAAQVQLSIIGQTSDVVRDESWI
ncbi:hypothetical protein D5038_19765 [Verminephrobacter aporrectodeae subsp. tuberculatae]|uniref:SwmB domain-containing protein n=1 Tax=Verminephrobacter aporrectodeae TaxID=1110389 RepID=UPI002237DCE0|nr:SwmB domain-containing protein [Verminephrobacter aporrectodeae]MCW5258499.1 hypothetical protein [Verminephrobacter aporrectodeae subsp. tuberculatae]